MKASELAALVHARNRKMAPVSVADHRKLARRRLPKAVFDYLEGGAGAEVSLRDNTAQFEDHAFKTQVFATRGEPDTGADLVGRAASMPLVLAPTGFTRLFHPDGEVAAASAAAALNVPYVLSTLATSSIEDVAAAAGGDLWFQLYIWRDRAVTRDMLQRARAAGYRVLVITADTPVAGLRERDARNGLTIPPALTARTALEGALHPVWWSRFIRSEPLAFANVRGGDAPADPTSVMGFAAKQFDRSVRWADVEEIAALWEGPVLIKGVLDAECADRAVASGAAGVIVSNHGGRQMDTTVPPLRQLAEIRGSLGPGTVVLYDGGVRRGSDIMKAVALGADAVCIGRPYLYGLAHGGRAGVEQVLQLFQSDLERDMTLVGVDRLSDLQTARVVAPQTPGGVSGA